jgi:hypothetical protein
MKRLWIALVLSLGLAANGWAADEWAVGDPAGTRNASDLDTYLLTNNAALDRFLQYGRHDCKISYASASTITVGTGSVVCSNSGGTVRHLRANTAAVTVTWGMIDTGAEEASKTYYLWAVGDADATTFTVMISLSNTAPTGATYYKRLGSFYNDSSSNITALTDDDGVGDGVVSTLKLKTTLGEVSTASTGALLALPGGEYGFYPQIKMSGGTGAATIGGDIYDIGNYYFSNTSYATKIYMRASGGTCYAQQRYVTASGEDCWIFLLIDKDTDEIISSYSAADHPAYGNGGDFEKVPHPFGNYDATKQEVVLVEKDIAEALKEESVKTGKSILTLINEDYKPKMSKKETYIPLHSGKFIDRKKEMVEKLPDYISVRKLTKLIDKEKQDKQAARQEKEVAEKDRESEEKLIQDKIRKQAIDALTAEGVVLKHQKKEK